MPSQHLSLSASSSFSWATRSFHAAIPPILTKQVALERNGQNVKYKTASRLSWNICSSTSPREYLYSRHSIQRRDDFLDDEEDLNRFSFQEHAERYFEASPSPPHLSERLQHHYTKGDNRPLSVINISPAKKMKTEKVPVRGVLLRQEPRYQDASCRPSPQYPLSKPHVYAGASSRGSDLCVGRAIGRRPMPPRRYKGRGPAVCPLSTREYRASLRRPAALKHTALPSAMEGLPPGLGQGRSCRGCAQMVSESIHQLGVEKRLPWLPFETLLEADEPDLRTNRLADEVSESGQALALSIAMQGISLVQMREECSNHGQVSYDGQYDQVDFGREHQENHRNKAVEERVDSMRPSQQVAGIGGFYPDTGRQTMVDEDDEDIWLELAYEEMAMALVLPKGKLEPQQESSRI